MSKMYVVTNPVPLHNNSPLVSLAKFVQVVCAAGYSPEIIGARLPADGVRGIPDSVPVRSFRYGGRGILKIFIFLLLQMKMFFWGLFCFKKNDVVYFWIADKMIGSFLAAKLRGAETNFFLYGSIVVKHSKNWARKLEQYMTDHADRVCAEAPSIFSECDIPENKILNPIQLFVPECGIEPKPFCDRELIIAVMSRLSREKHPFETIQAICRIHETMPDVYLRIIGSGPMEYQCRELVKKLGADGFIEFTGWLPADEAKRKLADCRVLIYPTDVEGVPGGILEAMSFGIPALASPVGGIPDVITDGVDGVILTDTDVDTIAAELSALLSSDKLSDMSDAATSTIKERFSLDAAAKNFNAVREGHTAE